MTMAAIKLKNPYLDAVATRLVQDEIQGPNVVRRWNNSGMDFPDTEHRDDLVCRFSWAIPNQDAIEAIAEHGPVVEIGAGTGYWAWMLRQADVDVIAYDENPPRRGAELNHWHKDVPKWTPVIRGVTAAAREHPDRTLMLCWPPYDDPMAVMALDFYAGDTLAYVGENASGCTGDERFHETLHHDWTPIRTVDIPQWECIRDDLTIYKRRGKR